MNLRLCCTRQGNAKKEGLANAIKPLLCPSWEPTYFYSPEKKKYAAIDSARQVLLLLSLYNTRCLVIEPDNLDLEFRNYLRTMELSFCKKIDLLVTASRHGAAKPAKQ